MTWKNGKQLASAVSSGRTVSYEYDKNGLRTSKTYNGTRYDFAYAGDKLVWQGWEGNEMYFFYDNTGAPIALWYFPKGGTRVTGYYFTNAQGDVVRIEDPDGKLLASYVYDVWGKVIVSSGSVSAINPLKYRGYYHDTETGFYYLQSRYYDPVVSRFINADSYASTGQGFLGYNMFAYCGNNPVNRVDASGSMHVRIDDFGGGGIAGSSSTFDKVRDTAWAFLQSATISGGVGTGIQGSAHVSPIVTSGGAKVDILAIELHAGKGVRIGQRGEAGASIGLDGSFGDAGKTLHIGGSESFFKSHLNYGWCSEHGWTWCECPNEEITNGVKSILGISASAYFIAGVSFDAGFDMNYFSEQFALIWK